MPIRGKGIRTMARGMPPIGREEISCTDPHTRIDKALTLNKINLLTPHASVLANSRGHVISARF